jgi:hypothetical protein
MQSEKYKLEFNMKYIPFFLLISCLCFSQEISRTTVSVVGNSTATSNGYYVSQSVGQLSNIGFSEMFSKSIVQGYQQPTGMKIIDASIEQETLQLYPIPVTNELNLHFSLSLEGKCRVELFDRLGRLVLNKELPINDFKSTISLENLASSTYIIKITNNTNVFYETIIKKD